MTKKPELTEAQHRIRTKVAWAVALLVSVLLGTAAMAYNLTRTPGRTDASFWTALWSSTGGQLKRAAQGLDKLRAPTADAEKRNLEQQVFPQFEKNK